MKGTKSTYLALLAVLLSPMAANADLIIQPDSVSVAFPLISSPGVSLNSGNDQSGLSTGYTSGVTDFDTYIASNPTHDNFTQTTFLGDFGLFSGALDFDLGGTFVLQSLALWNRGLDTQGIATFDLYFSDDAGFVSSTLIGSFGATAILGDANATLAEIFGFAPTMASFVRIDVTSVYGSCCISFGEVAFEGTVASVPEPGTLALLGIGLFGMGLARRGRKV